MGRLRCDTHNTIYSGTVSQPMSPPVPLYYLYLSFSIMLHKLLKEVRYQLAERVRVYMKTVNNITTGAAFGWTSVYKVDVQVSSFSTCVVCNYPSPHPHPTSLDHLQRLNFQPNQLYSRCLQSQPQLIRKVNTALEITSKALANFCVLKKCVLCDRAITLWWHSITWQIVRLLDW